MQLWSQLMIDGSWREGSEGQRFAVRDPSTGSTISTFASASIDDCLAAVEAAHRAQPGWASTAPRRRSEILRTAFEILRSEREELAELIVLENGKTIADARAESDYAAEFFRWFSEEAVRIRGDYRVSPAGDKRIVVTREPIGVSVLVTPWNFPAAMATRKLGPALAAGCTVVLKPASETPLTAARIVRTLERAGVPKGVVNLVTPTPTAPAVEAMLRHAEVRKLSFTGSTEVGRKLLHIAADSVLSVSMELGGNAPLLVLPGADIEHAVEAAIAAKLRNGGAACTAANRFYVHSSLVDAFTSQLADRFGRLRLGPGSDPNSSIGALVSAAEASKVHGLVQSALRDGALLVHGRSWSENSALYPPTILGGVRHGSPINRTEIFGPVVAIVPYDDVDDAIEMANDTEFGLVSYVLGPESDAISVAHRLESGMVAVNRGVLSDPAAPFGGMKQSGIGREGSSEGIEEFLEQKYIAI